ncbi:MAG: glycosyltransferase [Hellea sp.]|nr:glycosyltransferase [Hellea sp.]
MISVSLVIPVYTGADYLADLIAAIDTVRTKWAEQDYPVKIIEAIFVDDHSIDNSREIIAKLKTSHSWITRLQLSRNFGQHPATVAGILHTSGDWVVTMDEDLQHHPDHLITLLERAVGERADLIYAKPTGKVHGKASRDKSSRLFKRLMVWLTGNPFINQANSFRLIRGEVARGAASACNYETYLDVALSWFTTSIGLAELEMEDQRFQKTGKSGYSFRSLISHARRMLVSSQIKILRLGAFIGLLAVLVTIMLGLYVVIQKSFYPDSVPVQGWSSTIISIYFFSGVILFMVSILLELVSTLVQSTLGKPSYFLVDRTKDEPLVAFFKSRNNANPDA